MYVCKIPGVNAAAAQGWFIAGTIPLMLAGGLHALLALLDTVRPTYFAPIEGSVKPLMEGTGVRLRRMFPFSGGDSKTPSMWRAGVGLHNSHRLRGFSLPLLLLLFSPPDVKLVERLPATP